MTCCYNSIPMAASLSGTYVQPFQRGTVFIRLNLTSVTKMCMLISNKNKPFGLHSLYKMYYSAVRVKKGGDVYKKVCHILLYHIASYRIKSIP